MPGATNRVGLQVNTVGHSTGVQEIKFTMIAKVQPIVKRYVSLPKYYTQFLFVNLLRVLFPSCLHFCCFIVRYL